MKLPKLEKKIRVGLQWARELVLERDIAQYINPRDVASLYRLLEIARQPYAVGSAEGSAGESQGIRSGSIAARLPTRHCGNRH